MLKIRQFAFNPFGENTYLVYDSDTLEAIVIDSGMFTATERELFDRFVAENKLKLTQIVNTHLHLDHCFGANYLRERYSLPLAASPADAFLGASLQEQARNFLGDAHIDSRPVTIDRPLHQGDTVPVGAYTFHVLEVPGHSPGGLVLYSPEAGCAFTGDSIFRGSVGRTDLPGGDADTLIDSLRTKILTLPDSTQLFPGHDRSTTVAFERSTNPYLR